jgi:23S rRNA (pseudouridine1915-N3)-methyltransferase
VRLALAAVGKLKSGPEKALAEDYLERINQLGRQAGLKGLVVTEQPESQRPTADQRKAEEAELLLRRVAAGAVTVVFDERGPSLSSEGFAQLIRKSADQGVADFAFLIGGPDGHAASTREKANHVIGLGSMTWPHRLVRIMVLEQVYRAITILLNQPYHRA